MKHYYSFDGEVPDDIEGKDGVTIHYLNDKQLQIKRPMDIHINEFSSAPRGLIGPQGLKGDSGIQIRGPKGIRGSSLIPYDMDIPSVEDKPIPVGNPLLKESGFDVIGKYLPYENFIPFSSSGKDHITIRVYNKEYKVQILDCIRIQKLMFSKLVEYDFYKLIVAGTGYVSAAPVNEDIMDMAFKVACQLAFTSVMDSNLNTDWSPLKDVHEIHKYL